MKIKLLYLCCLFFTSRLSYGQTNINDSIYIDGRWRTFLIHLPSNFNSSKTYPLLLAFHGGGPLGYQSIQLQSRLTQKSDSTGFILVYPDGVKISGNRTWNAGGCCAPSTTLKIDDIGFVNALLNKLFASKPIDTTRVYATGFSNGALLCYRIANQLANRFAAIAPVAGNLMYYPWNPARAIPIISFHSYLDQNVKYWGGITTGSTGTYFPPQDSILNLISLNYVCKNKKDTLFHNIKQYDHFKYSNCACNAIIEQYVSYDGEHSWPGGLSSGGVNVSNQFNATYLMWQFFQKYTTKCQTSSISNIVENSAIQVYPNPMQGKVCLKNAIGTEIFDLYNSQGQLIWSGENIQDKDFSDFKNGLYFLKIDKKLIRLIKTD